MKSTTKQFRFLVTGDVIKLDGQYCAVRFEPYPQGKNSIYGIQVISTENESHDVYEGGKHLIEVFGSVAKDDSKETILNAYLEDKLKQEHDKIKDNRLKE
jgi:hypothetical protein